MSNVKSIIVQYPHRDSASDDVSQWRQIHELLDHQLRSTNNGESDGWNVRAGRVNFYLLIKEPDQAIDIVVSALRGAGVLGEATIVLTNFARRDMKYEVVWPPKYDGQFSF